MSIILGLLYILFAIILYFLKKKYVDPAVVVTSSWGGTLLLYGIIDHGMPELSYHIYFIIFLWTASLLLGLFIFNKNNESKFASNCRVKEFDEKFSVKSNTVIRRNLNVYFWISVLFFFPQCYISYKQATVGGDNFFYNLRMVSAGLIESEYSSGLFGYGKTFTIVCLLISLLIYKVGESKIRIFILFFIYFVLSILAVGKSQFLFLLISMLLVWSFNKKISKKALISAFLFLLIIFISLQLARSNEEDDNKDVVSGMFYSYLFGGLPALDLIAKTNMTSSEFGQNSFQFFYRFKQAFTDVEDKIEDSYHNDVTYDGYVFVPNPTNVYTIIGPFWLDFRYYGVIIFGLLYGVLFGFLYRKALFFKIYGIITYSLFVSSLVLPFFGEFILAYLSYFIQVFVLSYFVDKSFIKWGYLLIKIN
jgi:oligosaccharide repeat unit polymerase